MVEVRVEKVSERLGYARIVVTPAAEPTAAPGIIFRRESYQEPNLGRRGWQVREEQLAPAEVVGSGNALVLLVGPQITRHLDPAPYLFEIPTLHIHEHIFWPDGIDVFDGDLPPDVRPDEEPDPDTAVDRSGSTSRTEEPVASAKNDPKEEPAARDSPTAAPAGANAATSWTRRLVYSGAGLLLLLVIVAVASWFAFPNLRFGLTEQPIGFTANPPGPTTAPVEPGKVASEPAWPEGTDSLSPVEVVQRAPSGEAVYAVAQRRMRAGRYEDALVLYEQAAERGSAVASTALARMYDPNGFEPGKPYRNPDSRTAASYYKEAVARGDVDAVPLREALRQRLEKEAHEGNGTAAIALKDFWP
jgi:hypothetical protein